MYCKLKTVVLFLQIIEKAKQNKQTNKQTNKQKTTIKTATLTIIKPKNGAKRFSAVQKKPTFLAKGSF